MIVKVCGMRDADNIRAIAQLHPDAMGLIFVPTSPRYLAEVPAYLPEPPIRRVGIFLDAPLEEITERVATFGLQSVQLHGHESPDFCRAVKDALPGIRIIKTFIIATASDLAQVKGYAGVVDLYLFDSNSPSDGDVGSKFDWNILRSYTGPTPFLLSGGIGATDAPKVRALNHPLCIGVDINSLFELAPGIKSPRLVEGFINALRA